MLVEWLQYLATPCPKHLRAMGYPQEIIATQARYRRCREAWRPHLENTKAFILESAAAAKGDRTAVVLGSGMLLDVPLAELSQRFEQVILVDILHLPWVKFRARRYPNVGFQELDVTGVCEMLFEQVTQPQSGQGAFADLPAICPEPLPRRLGLSSIDFLASVNLLSQLPIRPRAYLEKSGSSRSEQDLEAFSNKLIAGHLSLLKQSAEEICLVADLERMICDSDGTIVDRETALSAQGVSAQELGKPGMEWNWDISPRPESYKEYDVCYRVGGFVL